MLPKVSDGVNGCFVHYRNLTLNHLLAPNNPPGQAVRGSGGGPGSAAGLCTGWGRGANKRLIQRNWKGSQKNKRWKHFSHRAGTSASLSKGGVGTASSRQRLLASHRASTSPATRERAASSSGRLLSQFPACETHAER